jgi:murein DD-endopeptidase MepM/ murein hydrolase activator NlpD
LVPAREDLPIVAEDEPPEGAGRDEHPRSFDPGLTTGDLKRGSRDHDLPVEIGAAPFDPGPGTGYDERRARRAAKRRRREEEKRLQRQAQLELAREEQERAEREARERERRARIERELAERERAEREARELAERQERERRVVAQREQERLEHRREELRQQRQREQNERELRLRREREQRRRKELARRRAKAPARAGSRLPRARTRPHPPRQPGLGWPTARAALALAAVSAVAGVFGTAVGLPVPVLGEPGGPIAASLTGNSLLDSGTPPGLTKGPYFPVVTGSPNFGEAEAKFGAERDGHIHQGQDVFVKPGTPLVAVRDGIVVDGGGGKSFYAYGGGHSLVIYSPVDDRSYVYMHMLHQALVHAGEMVHAGQPVGQVGCSGSCDGPHLHFEIRRGRVAFGTERKAIDPLPFLQQWPAAPAQ